jgi:hypothetical protein
VAYKEGNKSSSIAKTKILLPPAPLSIIGLRS